MRREANDLNTGLEEGEHGLDAGLDTLLCTLSEVRPLRGRIARKATEPEPQVASAPPPSPSPVGRGNRPYLGLTMWHLFEVHPLNSNIISW